jgi:hypothetical protein
MEDRQLYSLYIVTHTGHFTAVHGARPVQDVKLVHDLETLVEQMRPGRGKYYELYVARVTEDWQPTVADLAEIRRIQAAL